MNSGTAELTAQMIIALYTSDPKDPGNAYFCREYHLPVDFYG